MSPPPDLPPQRGRRGVMCSLKEGKGEKVDDNAFIELMDGGENRHGLYRFMRVPFLLHKLKTALT